MCIYYKYNIYQVDVKKALLKVEPFRMMMPIASAPMSGMRGNIRGQGGRGGKYT